MNTAQQIHHIMGVPVTQGHKQAHGNQEANATKSGPGRYHEQGDGKRTAAQKRAGAYGRGLKNWCNGKASKGRI